MFWKRKKTPTIKSFSFMVIGLGNPGKQYTQTRHNAGFRVINHIMATAGGKPGSIKNRDNYLCAEVVINGVDVILLQPLTYMNRSGAAVKAALKRYRVSPRSIIMIYDDLDLQPGVIRIRSKGGTGGHRGVASVIEHLGEREFPRIRVGIGRPGEGESVEVPDYVLERPEGREAELLESAEKLAAEAAVEIIINDVETAMNKYNPRQT